MLAWTQAELAARARVHEATVRGFELGRKDPIRVSLDAIRRALEEAGIVFSAEPIRGVGVFLRPDPVTAESGLIGGAKRNAHAPADKRGRRRLPAEPT